MKRFSSAPVCRMAIPINTNFAITGPYTKVLFGISALKSDNLEYSEVVNQM